MTVIWRNSRPAQHIVRIEVSDMREAQRQRLLVREARAWEGHDPDETAVLVDVEVVLADNASDARRQLAELGGWAREGSRPALRYVGTPVGFAGLIEDMFVAHVCDGVTAIPLGNGSIKPLSVRRNTR
jgi:alkanesulfonate monooxygenase SsuD/methylene tetrahydromethanopterin reductase-like flavin-dependent oxidoreductase (luciferase family)